MSLPIENVIAAYPPSVTVGRITLAPLSIGGVIRLSEAGVDVTKTPVPKDKLFAAAFILSENSAVRLRTSTSTSFRRFLRNAKCGLKELRNAVESVLNQAFTTRIPPQQPKGAAISFTPSGHGWALELLEFLCAEYGWSFDEALATPVCRAFALQAVARVRNGGKHGGPDYIERTLDIVKNSH